MMYRRHKRTFAVYAILSLTLVAFYLHHGDRTETGTDPGKAVLRIKENDLNIETMELSEIGRDLGQTISWTPEKDRNRDRISGESNEINESLGQVIAWTGKKDPTEDRISKDRREIDIDNGTAISWTQEKDPNTRTNQTHVLINGYMRSGSTFIGNLFNFRRDTFFWFEPLWRYARMKYYAKNGSFCSVKFPECSQPDPGDFKSLNRSLGFLMDIYNCNLGHHINRFVVQMMGRNAKRDMSYKRCRKSFSATYCYNNFIRACSTAKHIVTKTVRLDVHLTEYLLTKFETMKVLQLMRDPRAIINSRINTKWYSLNDSITEATALEQEIRIQCERMRSDIEGTKELAKRYPNRVRILQYEDMLNLREKAQKLYMFLGMDNESGNAVLENMFATTGLLHTDSYRANLTMIPLQKVQKYCNDVIELLGLRIFSSYAEMKTSATSIFRGNLPFEL